MKLEGKSNDDLCYIIRYTDYKNQAGEQLLKQSPSNNDLRYIIRHTDYHNQGGEQLLKQSPSNDDLRYIIRYTDYNNQGGEQLLKQSPNNMDLCYIIEYTDYNNQAGEQLLKQSPSNDDLRYIIEYTDHKNQAGEQLLKRLGYAGSSIINEAVLIKKIAALVVDNPEKLDMRNWHCGTSHCLAGWACVLDPIAREIEKDHGTELAGFAALPNYAYLFYSYESHVLEVLKTQLSK